uniref:Uncharacterized protein n=1 Tax=Glossina palpalis gambiensis TaxID=67801 RepID=A0A1B0BF25_9MUSC
MLVFNNLCTRHSASTSVVDDKLKLNSNSNKNENNKFYKKLLSQHFNTNNTFSLGLECNGTKHDMIETYVNNVKSSRCIRETNVKLFTNTAVS